MTKDFEYPMERYPYYEEEHLSKGQLYYDMLFFYKEELHRFIDIVNVSSDYDEMGLIDKTNYFWSLYDSMYPNELKGATHLTTVFLYKDREGKTMSYTSFVSPNLIVGEEDIREFYIKENKKKEK